MCILHVKFTWLATMRVCGGLPRVHQISFFIFGCKATFFHYYRKANLFRLGNLCCPDFPTGNARPGQKGVLLSRVTPTGTKGAASATWLAHPFVPVGGPFFSYFAFLNSFSILIKLMYWNSVCIISTNIYIYIYSYLYNICHR